MKTVVVVNPASAEGRTGRGWAQREAELRRSGVDFEVRETTARGEATLVARAALTEGVGRIVACGGDGTLNEVVNAFLDGDGTPASFPNAVLGVLPSGTSADFCKTAAIRTIPPAPQRFSRAARRGASTRGGSSTPMVRPAVS